MTRILNYLKGTDWIHVDRDQLASIARATPGAMAGYGFNVAVSVVAFSDVIPAGMLLVWALTAISLCGYIASRSLRQRPAGQTREPSSARPSAKNAYLFAVLLASPWALLTTYWAGGISVHREVVLMALAVGMAASGAVLLAPIPPVAVLYVVTILVPLTIKCAFILSGYHIVLAVLALSLLGFLISLISSNGRLFRERLDALHQLQASVEALSKAREETERVALTDMLTGLANRRAFMAKLGELGALDVSAPNHVIFYIDLDHFKAVNDALGHPVGDALLKAVAKRIQQSVRQRDLIARLGGDEFAILSHDIDKRDMASLLAERLVATLCEPFWIDGNRIQIGACVGVALMSESQVAGDQLLKHADLAMYAAKAAGRCGFAIFENDMRRWVEERRTMEALLRAALDAGELEMRYQPIRHLVSDTITSFEAQVWWRHPARGLLPSAQFLPIAKEIGCDVEIGSWALERACRHAAEWPEEITVVVGVSETQVGSGNLVDQVAATLDAAGLPAHRLELEITEKSLLENDAETLETLRRIRELGVAVTLDDFGTGHSSLRYLVSFPFERVKIDRLFVSQIIRSRQSEFVVRAVAQLTKSLNCTLIADGIETVEQLQRLQALQVLFGQGPLLGRPLPHAQTLKLLIEPPPVVLAQTA